ncbi:MAG: hypothetical protein AB4058_00125 [Microcystaceae cyanobacterium]
MSLVHWNRSVLSFHLKEIIEDHNAGNSTALVGLGAILLGTTVLPAAAKLGRPILKSVIKSGISLYEESKSEIKPVQASKSSPQSDTSPTPAKTPVQSVG